MSTEVNQNYFAWSQEESSTQDVPQGTPQLFSNGSISFGRFDLESLEWEKWSVFTNDRRHEEFGKFNGLVAKKKAYFEEYFKRIRELKALQQQNQQTELNLDYSGDGSDSSETGEGEPSADHGASTGFGALVDDSSEQKMATPTFEQEREYHDDHENESLVNEISESTPSLVVGLQQIGKQTNFSDGTDISLQNTYLSQDDTKMAHKTTLTPKRTISKETSIGQASKIIPMTVKMASNNIPARTIAPKGPCSGKPALIDQMAKPERRPRGATCSIVGAAGGSAINGLKRPSAAASQRPSTRERRPVTRDASRKPAKVTTPCRPSTSERRSATRDSALNDANNTTPRRPSTPDRHLITKGSAPYQSSIVTPGRPSTADRHAITKESTSKLSNIATPRRPSTADRRPATKESATKQPNIGSPHRPSTGERRPTTRNMVMKHVNTASSCRPSADNQYRVSREGAHVHAGVVTLQQPSTAERRPVTRDVAEKHATVPPMRRPSTAERRPVARDVTQKHVPSCRPSTAERRPVTRGREPALKHENFANSRCSMTPDRSLSKKSGTSTPRHPSTKRPSIINDSTLKTDQKTPDRLRAVPNCLRSAMSAADTPRKALTPNLVKSNKLENISYAKVNMEVHMDGKPKSSLSNLSQRKMWTSSVGDGRVLDSFRKLNKEGLQDRVQVQTSASNNTTSLQTRSVKTRAPIPPPPPPPPPPLRPSSIERKPIANNLPATGRKTKASTPRWR